MDPIWNNFLNQLNPLLNNNDGPVASKLTRKYYATSYEFKNNPNTSKLLHYFIGRIRASPLDVYPILLKLKLVLSKNKRDPLETLQSSRSHRYELRKSASTEFLTEDSGISDEPTRNRRVSFTTLSPRNDSQDQLVIASRSCRRPHPISIPAQTSQDVPPYKRRLYAKVPKNDLNNCRKLRSLERAMLHMSQKIEQLEVAESDLNGENSSYLRLHSLKRRYLKLWREFCRLRGTTPYAARIDRQTFLFRGSQFPELNRAVEKLVKTSRDMPDYLDIRTLVENVTTKEVLPLSPRKIEQEARNIFVGVVHQLKSRREYEFQRDLFHPPGADQADVDDDPALHDVELRRRLKENKLTAVSKLKSIMAKYCQLQEEEEEKRTKSSARDPSSEKEVEEPFPISTEDAKISCPVFLSDEDLREPEIPRPTKSSGSPPDTIVISDSDDEPEIVMVKCDPRVRTRPTFGEAMLNHYQVTLPMQNGSTMLISTAQKRVIQVIPPSK